MPQSRIVDWPTEGIARLGASRMAGVERVGRTAAALPSAPRPPSWTSPGVTSRSASQAFRHGARDRTSTPSPWRAPIPQSPDRSSERREPSAPRGCPSSRRRTPHLRSSTSGAESSVGSRDESGCSVSARRDQRRNHDTRTRKARTRSRCRKGRSQLGARPFRSRSRMRRQGSPRRRW